MTAGRPTEASVAAGAEQGPRPVVDDVAAAVDPMSWFEPAAPRDLTQYQVRRSSSELVIQATAEMGMARSLLSAGDINGAVEAARKGFQTARTQRSNQLVSEAWVLFLSTLERSEGEHEILEYRTSLDAAFMWAETMPDEIQVWLFPALEPHFKSLKLKPQLDRARGLRAAAQSRLERGGMSVVTRLEQFHLADLEARRSIDGRALALERTAGYYADELFDPDGHMLDVAAEEWRKAGRPDRANFVASLADRLRSVKEL